MPTELAIRNGHIAVAGTTEAEEVGRRILRGLPASARRYIQGMGADIAELSVLEHQLAKKEQSLKKKIAASADVQQLRQIKAKRKELRQQLQTAVQRVDGVVEAHLDEVMPGATIDEKVTALMASANVKQIGGKQR